MPERKEKSMKQPMTTKEFFTKINDILKENNSLPDILDYGLATRQSIPMTTYEYSIRNNLDYGGSEDIYLDLWIEFMQDGEMCKCELGTYKTLRDDKEAMHIMAGLLADFIVTEHTYVNNNLDDFTWEGADVYCYDENGNKYNWGYTCATMERAIIKKDELIKKHPRVDIRDNATRKTKTYKQEEKNND